EVHPSRGLFTDDRSFGPYELLLSKRVDEGGADALPDAVEVVRRGHGSKDVETTPELIDKEPERDDDARAEHDRSEHGSSEMRPETLGVGPSNRCRSRRLSPPRPSFHNHNATRCGRCFGRADCRCCRPSVRRNPASRWSRPEQATSAPIPAPTIRGIPREYSSEFCGRDAWRSAHRLGPGYSGGLLRRLRGRCLHPRVAAALASLLVLSTACRDSRPAVVLSSKDGASIVVLVEVADTPDTQSRGLMFRNHLDPDHGMVFLFDTEK